MIEHPFLARLAATVALCIAGTGAWAQANVPRPDLGVLLSGPPDLQHGRDASYTVQLKNSGVAGAGRVVMTLTVPNGLAPAPAYRSMPGGPLHHAFPAECRVPTATTVVCTYNSVASGETKYINIGLRAGSAQALAQLTASASVQTGTTETNLNNNTVTLPVLVSSFTPQITFPANNASMLICMGKANLLDCSNNTMSRIPLDANGQLVAQGGRFVATAGQPGTLVMDLFNNQNVNVATWTMTTFGSRCYQGPAVYHTLGATFEARVCY